MMGRGTDDAAGITHDPSASPQSGNACRVPPLPLSDPGNSLTHFMKPSVHSARHGVVLTLSPLNRIKALLVGTVLGFLALSGSGCSGVQPWERATLTSYPMRSDRDPLALAMSEHIYFSREATVGGRGVGGSGCGCN